MNRETLKQAIELSETLGHVFVATADASGLPHIAAAGRMKLVRDGLVEITSWFCPLTIENLIVNKHITLVVWDQKTDTGYQLTGASQKVEDLHILNGYVPEIEAKSPFPQVERKVTVTIDKVIGFKHAPHTDGEI